MTLVLAGLATCAVGVAGGIAANPVMRQIVGEDWRERYRAPVDRASDPVVDDFALASWRPFFIQAEQPAEPPHDYAFAEEPLPPPPPVMDDPWAGQEPPADLGRRVVSAALDLTSGIGAEDPQAREEEPADAAEPEPAPAQPE